MKINKKLFDKVDTEVEKKKLLDELLNERTYIQIAILYQQLVLSYGKKRIWFLSPNQSTKIKETKTNQIIKLIKIVVDLGVMPEVYMRAQFESLIGWIRKVNPKLGYVPFTSMLTDKAIERFNKWDERQDKRYSRKDKRRVTEFFKTEVVDIGGSTAQSARTFYKKLLRLRKLGKLNRKYVFEELELMARGGALSNIYVWSNPLTLESGSPFLLEMYADVNKKLTPAQKQSMKRIRTIVLGVLKSKEIKKYV